MGQVLAIVVGYKNPHLSIRAVLSLKRQTAPVDIVLWDNFSSKQTCATLESAQLGVNLVCDPENSLWTPAINKAAERYLKDQEFILLMNNDCELPRGTLRYLINVFEQHPDAGMVGPLIPAIGGPNEPINCRDHKVPFRCPFLMGACILIRKTVWDELIDEDGYGLDFNMPLGADDHDLSIRVKHHGYSLWVDPRVIIHHAGHASGNSPEWDKYGGPSWDYFNTKWAGYYATEDEALRAHWGGLFDEDCQIGTGWIPGEFSLRMRGIYA